MDFLQGGGKRITYLNLEEKNEEQRDWDMSRAQDPEGRIIWI
jgi:hypothetical protein